MNLGGAEKMRCVLCSCITLLTVAFACAQVENSDRTGQLYPSDDSLVAAARHGYSDRKDVELFSFNVQAHKGRATDCLPLTQTIGVAGPLALAAMQGRGAYVKSSPVPESRDLLHVKGTILLRVVFYATKKEDRAEAWLVQGAQQVHPVSDKLEAIGTETCRVAETQDGARTEAFTGAVIWRVSELYAIRFRTDNSQLDFNGPIKVFVRRNGREEEYEIDAGKAFESETKRFL